MIELAKEFPHFGYIKEEAAPIIARTRELCAAKPTIRRVFSARGAHGWLYESHLGTEGLITERAVYADVLTRIWELMQSGKDPDTVRDMPTRSCCSSSISASISPAAICAASSFTSGKSAACSRT